jgi:L-histidine N-alpha-methyltransferase
MSPAITTDIHITPDDITRALREDVRRGLTADPKWLPPKWFYDDRGSALFEEITRLDEYYPTRREREILDARANAIAAASGAGTLVELGSGTSEKTRLLLEAFTEAGLLERFIPFDISEATLRGAADKIVVDFDVDVHAVVGDFEHHLEDIPAGGRRLIAFLGGTIGNFEPDERTRFLSDLATTMRPGDSFLLGTDLVKDRARLIAAYDDARGVTAAFNRNVLHVLNRELGAAFDPHAFEHVALWDDEHDWIEMRLRSTRPQVVPIDALALDVSFAQGEEMRTEISAKFREETVRSELARAGLRPAHWWTDAAGDFALSLSFRDA